MDEHNRRLQRWMDADEDGRDDEADVACRALFAEVTAEPVVPPTFTSATLAAIAGACDADRLRVRRLRHATVAAGIAASLVAVYFVGPFALAALWNGFIGFVGLLADVTVKVAVGVRAGNDVWSVLANIGRTAAAVVADPKVTIAMIAMQAAAMAALVALRRLLDPDRESLE